MDLENITGPMENNTRVNGAIIKCTEKEPLSGKIRRNIKASSSMTSARAEEHSVGLMADNMSANGKPENNMEKEPT